MPVIYVINASSRTDTGITADLKKSLHWADRPGLVEVRCVTLEDGPNGISTERDSNDAAPAVLRFIERMDAQPETAGFVIACFSDPGLHAARDLTRHPVAGIGEAGLLAGLGLGDRIGTISVSAGGESKIRRQLRQIGVGDRLAGHRGLGLDYGQLRDPAVVTDRLIAAARSLSEENDAKALIFAGAGMARYVVPVSEAVGLPVVDPTQAAGGLVLAQYLQASYRMERQP